MIEGANWRRWVFFWLPVALFLLFLLLPFYWMVITTFRPTAEINVAWRRPSYQPFWTWNPTLVHVKYLLGETSFPTWIWNTMFIATVATAISLFCGVLAGYALSRLNFKWAGLLGTTIFITYLVPQTLLFIPLSEIIRSYNIGDTPWALILTYPTFLIPFSTWLLMGYFKAIPKELEECARIDGATRFQAMWQIIIPVAVPGILSAMIFAFTLSWNEYIYALVFLSSPEQKTVPIGVVSELIKSVDFAQRPFTLTPNYSAPVMAHTVIVATGAAARWIGLENEIRLAKIGGGVSACAVCDGALPHYRNKRLAVVGGGDTAMEETLYLTKFASEVVVIHRKDKFRASKVMADRVLNHPKVRVEWNTVVTDVLGDGEISGVQLQDTVSGATRTLDVGGLFIAIGHAPNTGFLDGQLELTPFNYIKVSSWRTCTNVAGVFAAGDAIDDYYRQAITSAGTGCMAALEAERWLAHHGIGESPMLHNAVAPVVIPPDDIDRASAA